MSIRALFLKSVRSASSFVQSKCARCRSARARAMTCSSFDVQRLPISASCASINSSLTLNAFPLCESNAMTFRTPATRYSCVNLPPCTSRSRLEKIASLNFSYALSEVFLKITEHKLASTIKHIGVQSTNKAICSSRKKSR